MHLSRVLMHFNIDAIVLNLVFLYDFANFEMCELALSNLLIEMSMCVYISLYVFIVFQRKRGYI